MGQHPGKGERSEPGQQVGQGGSWLAKIGGFGDRNADRFAGRGLAGPVTGERALRDVPRSYGQQQQAGGGCDGVASPKITPHQRPIDFPTQKPRARSAILTAV